MPEMFPGYPFESEPNKLGEKLGDGHRMSSKDKGSYIEEHYLRLYRNMDFVSVETYMNLFKGLDLEGKRIVDIGAGAAIGPDLHDRPESPILAAINAINPDCTYIPVDADHRRTLSWLLLESKANKGNEGLHFEPVTADAAKLPFPDNSVDVYLSTNLINAPQDLQPEKIFVENIFSEAYRILKPDGTFVVSSFGYLWQKYRFGLRRYNDRIEDFQIVTKEEIIKTLSFAGFNDITELPLDEAQVRRTEQVLKKGMKSWFRVEAGVHEACAFKARK